MTKTQILDSLNELGNRFVRAGGDEDLAHHTVLGVAFGVAWFYVSSAPAEEVEALAEAISRLGLQGGSVQ